LGNSIYVLVTGLFPYYELGDSEKEANRKVKQGVHPYVDTRYRNRSVVERELIDVMERCWEFDPDSRVSSFEVVSRLRNLKAMVAEKQI
jgi:serine/threonine protein kinase